MSTSFLTAWYVSLKKKKKNQIFHSYFFFLRVGLFVCMSWLEINPNLWQKYGVCSLELGGTVCEWSCCSLSCSAVRKCCCGIVFTTSSLLWLKWKSVISSNKPLLLPISSCSGGNLNFTVSVVWRRLCSRNTRSSTLVKYMESLPLLCACFYHLFAVSELVITTGNIFSRIIPVLVSELFRILLPQPRIETFLIVVELQETDLCGTLVIWKKNLSCALILFFFFLYHSTSLAVSPL